MKGNVYLDLDTFQSPSPYNSYLQLLDDFTRPFILPNKWYHICVSYSESNNTIIEVLVSIESEDLLARYLTYQVPQMH